MFAILSPGGSNAGVSLKCDPGYAEALRGEHPGITPGYHLNKKHWNTVRLDGSVPDELVAELVEHSYRRVVAGFPKLVRLRLTGD